MATDGTRLASESVWSDRKSMADNCRQATREGEREGGMQGGREVEEGKRRVRKKRLDVRDRFLEATYKSVFKGCCSFLFFVVGLIALE